MGLLQSNLSSTGFDYVVAVTQPAINAALEEWLYDSDLPEIRICYVYDQNLNPVPVDYDTFVADTGNIDPSSVPAGTPASDPRVQKLATARFAFAVKVKPGLPPGVPPASLPPVVALKPGQSSVTYTMLFAEFVAATIGFGPLNSMTWFNESQPAGTAWTFSGDVDLDLQDTSFESLPATVQAQIKDNGDPGAFSPQQLLYDLNNSGLEQGFHFSQIPTDIPLSTFMTADFVNTYLAGLKDAEILGYSANYVPAVPPSSLAVTDLNFFTPQPVGSEGAPATVNYLCATNQHKLPGLTEANFAWNWIEPAEASQYDGVAALNRNTFANYLANANFNGKETLLEYVQQNCIATSVKVTLNSLSQPVYNYGLTSGQSPTVSFPASGGTVLSYAYDSGTASDEAGAGGCLGQMTLASTFTMNVSVQDDQIVVWQHLVISTYIQHLQSGAGGNVVDKQLTDTYTIGVDDSGELVITLASSVPVDNSKTPGVNNFLNFFTDVNGLASSVAQKAQAFAATKLADIPVSIVQNFVFPSGKVFVYADACFSDSQDLVSHITYADPAPAGTATQDGAATTTSTAASPITAAQSVATTVESAIKNTESAIEGIEGQ
jgi:hypothetical protein